jgi:hypothetical protein
MKQIIEINESGLTYIDDGTQRFIDFEECCHNPYTWDKDGSPQYFDPSMRVIGFRNVDATPLYMKFFTNPHTLFEFSDEKSFYTTSDAIEEAGWQTFDVS